MLNKAEKKKQVWESDLILFNDFSDAKLIFPIPREKLNL